MLHVKNSKIICVSVLFSGMIIHEYLFITSKAKIFLTSQRDGIKKKTMVESFMHMYIIIIMLKETISIVLSKSFTYLWCKYVMFRKFAILKFYSGP